MNLENSEILNYILVSLVCFLYLGISKFAVDLIHYLIKEGAISPKDKEGEKIEVLPQSYIWLVMMVGPPVLILTISSILSIILLFVMFVAISIFLIIATFLLVGILILIISGLSALPLFIRYKK